MVGCSVGGGVGSEVGETVGGAVGTNVGEGVGGDVGEKSVGGEVGGKVGNGVGNRVGAKVVGCLVGAAVEGKTEGILVVGDNVVMTMLGNFVGTEVVGFLVIWRLRFIFGLVLGLNDDGVIAVIILLLVVEIEEGCIDSICGAIVGYNDVGKNVVGSLVIILIEGLFDTILLGTFVIDFKVGANDKGISAIRLVGEIVDGLLDNITDGILDVWTIEGLLLVTNDGLLLEYLLGILLGMEDIISLEDDGWVEGFSLDGFLFVFDDIIFIENGA